MNCFSTLNIQWFSPVLTQARRRQRSEHSAIRDRPHQQEPQRDGTVRGAEPGRSERSSTAGAELQDERAQLTHGRRESEEGKQKEEGEEEWGVATLNDRGGESDSRDQRETPPHQRTREDEFVPEASAVMASPEAVMVVQPEQGKHGPMVWKQRGSSARMNYGRVKRKEKKTRAKMKMRWRTKKRSLLRHRTSPRRKMLAHQRDGALLVRNLPPVSILEAGNVAASALGVEDGDAPIQDLRNLVNLRASALGMVEGVGARSQGAPSLDDCGESGGGRRYIR